MKILAFGAAREIIGQGILNMPIDAGITADELKVMLEAYYPRLKQLRSFALAVNSEYATGGLVLKDSDEVAIIPPVSGG